MSLQISASGMQNATERHAIRANNIANLNTPGFRAARPESVERPANAAPPNPPRAGAEVVPRSASNALPPSDVDLAVELTGTLLDVRDVQANAAAFRAQDEVLGEVLDIGG